mmetsp:Transcript_3124/g.3717  ORF Transcript_3124/g.3717 Transcript_3124/m.3717 type:complete len:294 (+) Transcript_3124:75-956(+)
MQTIETRISEGDHYGALQSLKVLLVRASKKNNFDKVTSIGHKGSVLLLKRGFGTAGLDVSLNLIELWVSSGQEVTEEKKRAVKDICEAFSTGINDKAEAAKLNSRFLNAALDWSKCSHKSGGSSQGEPSFHYLAAKSKIQIGDAAGACEHFLHAQAAVEFAAFLVLWSKSGYPSERDMFLARAILKLLAEEHHSEAKVVFNEYIGILESDNIHLSTPLYNFTRFLLTAIEKNSYPLFMILREKYRPVLKSDPSFDVYLDKMQERIFNVKPQKKGMAAMMDNILGMFGGNPSQR